MSRTAIHALDSSMVMILYSSVIAAVVMVSIIFCGIAFSADTEDDIPEYVIGPGDVISVSVWQYEQFNSTTIVGPDGKITVNLLGDIPVAGLTRAEVKKEVGNRLAKFIKEGAEVTVSIVQFNSRKISVFGQVVTSSTITFSSAPSLIEVIMVRSVPTADADLTAIKIIPADPSIRQPIVVNLAEILAKGNVSQLPKLHPGDIVYVPRIETGAIEEAADAQPQVTDVDRTAIPSQPPSATTQAEQFVINVMGAVGRPGSFVSDKELSLTEALLQAGSVTNSMALKYVRVIRGMPTEGDRVVHVDVEKYLIEGDVTLLPRLYSGDTIYVPDMTQEQMKDVSILITGEVLSPGSYSVSEPLDILDIISMAGGLTPNADTERIRVRREDADSYQEKIVNIDEFLRDVESEVLPEMVGPGYRIYVPTQQKSTSAIAGVTRGLVAFLADVALVFSFWRVVGD